MFINLSPKYVLIQFFVPGILPDARENEPCGQKASV